MNSDELDDIIEQYGELYPPLLTSDQAEEMSGVPKGTIYDWSHRGLLDKFKFKRGKRMLLGRDSFLRFLMSEVAEAELELLGSG